MVCQEPQWCAESLPGVSGVSLVCQGPLWCVRGIPGVPGVSLVCQGHPWCVRSLPGVSGVSLGCQESPWCARSLDMLGPLVWGSLCARGALQGQQQWFLLSHARHIQGRSPALLRVHPCPPASHQPTRAKPQSPVYITKNMYKYEYIFTCLFKKGCYQRYTSLVGRY